MAKPWKKPCQHSNVHVGEIYEVCADCGATRYRDRVGVTRPRWDLVWHSCDLCRHGEPKGQ